MRYLLYIVLIGLLFVSCQNKQGKALRLWEKEKHQTELVRFIDMKLHGSFTAQDSIVQLKMHYQQLRQQRLLQLNTERDTLTKALSVKGAEYLSIENETMKRYFKMGLERMEDRLLQLEENVLTYQNHPELTQLNAITETIFHYRQDTNEVLGYVYRVSFFAKQGRLPKEKITKSYLFDCTKTRILGELKN